MFELLYSPELLEAEKEAKAKFAVVTLRKNELAVEAGTLAIELAHKIGKSGIKTARSYSFRDRGGFRQWNVSGLPLPESVGDENITSFVASGHKSRGPLGLRAWSLELEDGDSPGIGRDFELSVNNTAYHPKFGTPYSDFYPSDLDSFSNDPELLIKSYETAGQNQLDSANYILGLVNRLQEVVQA